MSDRIALCRHLGDAGQYKHLVQRQRRKLAVEVKPRRTDNAIDAVSEIGDIHIEFQYPLFSQPVLRKRHKHQLFHLAQYAMVKVEIQIFDQLLGDRAASGNDPPLAKVLPKRLGDHLHVKSGMLKEARVFDLNEKVRHPLGDFGKGAIIRLAGSLFVQPLDRMSAQLQHRVRRDGRAQQDSQHNDYHHNAHVFL